MTGQSSTQSSVPVGPDQVKTLNEPQPPFGDLRPARPYWFLHSVIIPNPLA